MMNKVVLITGGARRIGAETANYLHSKGMNILITYSKSASAARALKKSLNSKREKSCEIYRVEFKSNLNYKKIVNDISKIFLGKEEISVLKLSFLSLSPKLLFNCSTKKFSIL